MTEMVTISDMGGSSDHFPISIELINNLNNLITLTNNTKGNINRYYFNKANWKQYFEVAKHIITLNNIKNYKELTEAINLASRNAIPKKG